MDNLELCIKNTKRIITMRNGTMTRWDLTDEKKFAEFLRELQDYLKTKLTRHGDYWDCEIDHHSHDPDIDEFENTKVFCEKKNFNFWEVKEMIDELGGYQDSCGCECEVVNHIKIDKNGIHVI
jgi:hypothetical protein